MTFLIAWSIDDAVHAMAEGARPVAGGSDLVVGARHGAATLPDQLVAIDRIADLAVIEDTPHGLRIGAGVTHAVLMSHESIVERRSALADAAALVGSPATRNVGTIGGNVMNASPAMDTGAPLVVLDAQVELQSTQGTRTVPVADVWVGPGQTAAGANELCTALLLPPAVQRMGSAYVRLEYRRAMEIAIVGAGAKVVLDREDNIADLAVALSAVAPTILAVESIDVVGRPINEETLDVVAKAASAQAEPISDLRASDDYRRHTIGVMAKRAVAAAARRASGERIAVPVNRSVGIGASS